MAEQADRNRKSIKPQTFINEIKATDTLNLEFNDSSLTNLTFLLYINAVYTTIAIFIVGNTIKSLIFVVFISKKEKIAEILVSTILNSSGA